MKFYVYFKGSLSPDRTFTTLFGAKEHMESNRLTGVVVIGHYAVPPEVIWYNQGKRR